MTDTAVLPKTDPSWFRIAIREMTPGLVQQPGRVWQRVGDVFSDFCGKGTGNRFSGGQAYWVTSRLAVDTLADHELIVYLVSGVSASLIKKNYSRDFARNPPSADALGMTVAGATGVISEVYAGREFFSGEPELLANLIIHELMHNKTSEGNEMHNRAPFVGANGGFAQAFFANMSPLEKMAGSKLYATRADKDAMIPALERKVAQFLGA